MWSYPCFRSTAFFWRDILVGLVIPIVIGKPYNENNIKLVCLCIVCKKNAGILFRFLHLFPYFNDYGRSSATIFHVDVNIYILFIAKRVWVHYRELICFSKNLSVEQIEIFQFCLKIRHLWRLPHSWVGAWVVGCMGGLIGRVR